MELREQGRFDRVDDRGDHIGTGNALLLLHVFENGQDFAAHGVF